MSNLKKYSPSNKISIIFLHGFPYDSRMWKYQMELEGINLYALDLLGAGSKKNSRLFTLEKMVDIAFEEIKTLKWNHLILCGLSMGGYVAQRMYEKYPQSFQALIFCDTRSEADTNEAKLKRAAGVEALTQNGLNPFIENFLPQAVYPNAFEKNPKLKAELLEIANSQDPLGLASQLLAMQGRTDTTHVLSKIQIPTLVICGDGDQITSKEDMQKFSASIPNSEFQSVLEAGHMAPFEKPEIVNNIIQNFIKKIEINI